MIYLDHNATCPLCDRARERMREAQEASFGNPSSPHAAGRAAKAILEEARRSVAGFLGASRARLFFAPSGTSANLAALLALAAIPGTAKALALAAGEHPSVAAAAAHLAEAGFETRRVALDPAGRVDPEAWRALARGAGVATACLASGETGAVNDLARLGTIARRRGARMHSDAVQALGKVAFSFDDLPIDTLSVSAHKIGGPQGIGALAVARGVELPPFVRGLTQEGGLFPGTEPVLLAAGFAGAVEEASRRRAALPELRALRDRFVAGLAERSLAATLNGPLDGTDTGVTASVTLPWADAAKLVMFLDLRGICAGRGPSCRSGAAEPSEALVALGLSREAALGTIRVSFGPGNTDADVKALLDALAEYPARPGGRDGRG